MCLSHPGSGIGQGGKFGIDFGSGCGFGQERIRSFKSQGNRRQPTAGHACH